MHFITLHVAGFLHPAIFWYFHHSSDKSGLKVTDCTAQSAEYWCSYGTIKTVAITWFVLLSRIKNCKIVANLHTLDVGTPDEDELHEIYITETNMVYRVVGDSLEPYEAFWGLTREVQNAGYQWSEYMYMKWYW